MKMSLALAFCLLFFGCASNPLMTGEPHDWVGHTADELEAGKGKPTRTVKQPDGSVVWEYVTEGTFVREHITPGKYENVERYRIRNGKVKEWFTERFENGVSVRRDH